MEFCITVLVNHFAPPDKLRAVQPVMTAWGAAWRLGEEGAFDWKGGLRVRKIPPLTSLLRFLPQALRDRAWEFVDVTGEGLSEFERQVNSGQWEGVGDAAELSLTSLLRELLSAQDEWVVFFQKDCEDIAITRRESMSELLRTVVNAYTRGTAAKEAGGFCVFDY